MLALHALGVLAVTAAVLLGLWQYGAWQSHRELQSRDLAGAAPRPLDDVLSADAAFPNDQVGRPVTLAGTWLPRSTVEVTDRALDGRPGRWLVTPVAVCASGPCERAPAILVVRGWLPVGADRPAPPQGRVEVTGWLQPGEGQGLPDPDPRDDVLPELRIASAIQRVDQDLYGGYVVARDLAGPASAGLRPVPPAALPEPTPFTALRNLLYAVEWFVFGGFAVYIWWRWARDELARATTDTDADEGDAGAGDAGEGDAGADDPEDGAPPVGAAGIRSTP